jgi:hypothetical protein
MAKTQGFDFADPDFNFPEFFESFNIQPETDPFSLGPKPAGVSGAATPSEQAFSAASAVNQNDPPFFQSLIDSGRLRLDDDLPGGGTGTQFGQAGSAIPNYALESAMGAGDGGGDGGGGLSGGNVNTRNIGEMFPGFDSGALAKSVSGFAGGKLKDLMGALDHHKQRLATEFFGGLMLGGGPIGGGIAHGIGNVFEADRLRRATGVPEQTGFLNTMLETGSDFFGQSRIFDFHDMVDQYKNVSIDPVKGITSFSDVREGQLLSDPDPDLAEAIRGFDPADAAAGFEISRGSVDPDIAFDIDFTGSLGGDAEPSDPGIFDAAADFDVNRDDRHGPTDREREQERERSERH